jgi:hypothetical protein
VWIIHFEVLFCLLEEAKEAKGAVEEKEAEGEKGKREEEKEEEKERKEEKEEERERGAEREEEKEREEEVPGRPSSSVFWRMYLGDLNSHSHT